MSEARPRPRMQEHRGSEIVRLLETALAPVEPPASLADELESRLVNLQTAALETLEELSEWEPDVMRDPRNWVRPVAALTVGTAAGAALVVLRMRSRRQQAGGLKGLAEHGGREVLDVLAWTRSRIR